MKKIPFKYIIYVFKPFCFLSFMYYRLFKTYKGLPRSLEVLVSVYNSIGQGHGLKYYNWVIRK